jgi:hypothetical protein
MDSLPFEPRLAESQFLDQSFSGRELRLGEPNLGAAVLWVADRGTSQPLTISLEDTPTCLVLQIQFLRGRFDLQVTPETVLVSATPPMLPDHYPNSAGEFIEARFHSLIPLPIAIEPQTAIADLEGGTLTLTMIKSKHPPRAVTLTIPEPGQRLSHARGLKANSAAANAELN